MNEVFWETVRNSIIGRDSFIRTPFGDRLITYADYTASGRGITFIEEYMRQTMELYANTHTEDNSTGIITSQRLHQAESRIKKLLNAGRQYKIIATGSGATGAVHHLQEILGVYLPPVGRDFYQTLVSRYFQGQELSRFETFMKENRPVVFVGPYEHHSNEVSWRECFVDVVEIELTPQGLIDLKDLKRTLSSRAYAHRLKIGSFSAASNVTGIKTPVYEVARILHSHGALAFFDYAAIAPYGKIDVTRDKESYFDGIFFSPHKFLGGPGGSGILIIHENIYRKDLPPSCGAGGTVDFVNFSTQEYLPDIETREKAGTPGILQIMRAALALELKEQLDTEKIEKREKELVHKALKRLGEHPRIEIIGNLRADLRIAIFSFNIKAGDSYLHPRFVIKLLNDLFGIQARAGCSCAGPYGHRLLHISKQTSLQYREEISHGHEGVKPGWARINFHFLITEEEFDFICNAVLFVASRGKYFLPCYDFNLNSGKWQYKEFQEPPDSFGIEEALDNWHKAASAGQKLDRKKLYQSYLDEAQRQSRELEKEFNEAAVQSTERSLIPFVYYP